jgi:hypothetical protein
MHTPKHPAEKILTSRSALEGERKRVTVLFADVKGSMELLADRDPEEARKLLDPVLERMMEAVHRYEGTVNQVMGDGIMALFGAPVAHEDHAARACYAALDLQRAMRRLTDLYLRCLAEAHLLAGRHDAAAREAGRALDLTREWGERPAEAWTLWLLGEIATRGARVDAEAARARYRETLALAEAFGLRPLVAHCHHGLGKLDRRMGRREQTRKHLTTATTLYREMDMRFWLEPAGTILSAST